MQASPGPQIGLTISEEEAGAPEQRSGGQGWGVEGASEPDSSPGAGAPAPVEGAGREGGWRSVARRALDSPLPSAAAGSDGRPSPTPAQGTSPRGPKRTTISWDAVPAASGPSVVAGRLTADGVVSSRVASARSQDFPQPLRLASSLRAPPGPSQLGMGGPGADADSSPLGRLPSRFAAGASSARSAVSTHSAHSLGARITSTTSTEAGGQWGRGEEQGQLHSPAASSSGVGWRKAVDVLAASVDGGGSGGDGNVLLSSAQSIWRSLTKSLSSRKDTSPRAPQEPAAGLESKAAAGGLGAGMATPFQGPTARAALGAGTAAAAPVGKGAAASSFAAGDGAHASGSRRGDAADRAVREIDAERAARAVDGGERSGAGSSASEGESGSEGSPGERHSPGRRLRFNNELLDSKHSSPRASLATSRSHSFRDRVASALGLGALVHKPSTASGASIEAKPSESERTGAVQRVQSVLKKEGTSKQLRLGFTAEDSDSSGGKGDSDGDGDGGYRALTGGGYKSFKEEGAEAANKGTRLPPLRGIAHLPLESDTHLGLTRVDSAVVPARLHIFNHPVDDGKEDVLISPAEPLPPGESLPSPFVRPKLSAADIKLPSGLSAPPALPAEPGTLRLPSIPGHPPGADSPPRALKLPSISGHPLGARSMRDGAAVKFGGTSSVRFGGASADGASAAPTEAASAAGPGVLSVAPSFTSKAPTEVASTAPAPKARSTIKLPIITTGHWDSLVFATVWRVGRVFGFQAFNVRPATQSDSKREYVPASIFAAADHLIQLLVKNGYVRRNRGDDSDDERFGKALFEFHSTIFYSYEMQWTKMQRLSPRPQRYTDELRERVFSDQYILNGLLSELALYFLIFTEAANVRFCPEAMWWIFWCMNHSYVMADLWNQGSPNRMLNARDGLPQLRNTFQHLIRELQMQIGIRPAEMRPEDCGKMSSILTRLSTSDVALADRELLADLVSFGDGGFFMDRIITPIFYVMSYEIDHLATLGVDTAHRLGYDDFNESLTCRSVVYNTLMSLRVTPHDIATGATNDAYQSLTSMGFRGRTYIDNKFDPQVAAEWWRNHVFVKTYRERRSWWGVYRAFFRVYAFHFVLFHAMQAQAFAGWNWRIVSSAILTHAWLSWLERVANWMMTLHSPEPLQTTMTKIFDRKGFFRMDKISALAQPGRRTDRMDRRTTDRLHKMMAHQAEGNNEIGHKKVRFSIKQLQAMQPERVIEIEGAPLFGLFGGLLEWLLISIVLTLVFALQFADGAYRDLAHAYWGYIAAGYTGLHLVHFLLTTRDGYAISLTQALHLPEYFQNWSVRPTPRTWMYSAMKTNWKNFAINVLFWLMVMCMKVPFDYFVIHKPLVKPVRLLLTRKWLGCKGPIYRLPGGLSVPCVGGDWILVVARMFPFIIVALFDTALFYQFVVTAFGIYHGLIKLDLGVISSWEDLVREFHKSPPRWWLRCMSFTGNENQKNLLFSTISANAQAAADSNGTVTANSGEGPKQNVAISDGLMFKIKIVTPEEIRAKQGLMLKERRINMQAGKAGPASEVEGKAVNAVQRAGTNAPGTAANTRPGTTTGAGGGKGGTTTGGGKGGAATGGAGAASASKGDTRSGGAAAAAAAFASLASSARADASKRPLSTRTTRGGATLVGQDYKDSPAAASGGLFGWRSSANGDGSNSGPAAKSAPASRFSIRNRTSTDGDPAAVEGTASGKTAARPAGRRDSAPAQVGGGMAGMLKTLGNVALSAAAVARKGANQVQPEPVAESVEHGGRISDSVPARAWARASEAPAAAERAGFPAASRPADPPPRARHPAWQPHDLLGHGHADYDPALDLSAPESQLREQQGGGTGGWGRVWPWRSPRGEQAPREGDSGDAGLPLGPAFGAMLAHGWKPRQQQGAEIQPADEEQGGATAAGSQERQEQRQGRGRQPGARVYRGPVGEGILLVGPDGKPLPDADDGREQPSRPRPQPFVLMSEVPLMRVDSDGHSEHDEGDVHTQGRGSARVGFADGGEEDGPGRDRSLHAAVHKAGGAMSAKFRDVPVTVVDDFDDDVTPRASRSSKPPSMSNGRQRRASFITSLFRLNSGVTEEEDPDAASAPGTSHRGSGRTQAGGRASGKSDPSTHRDKSVRGGGFGTPRISAVERSVRGGGASGGTPRISAVERSVRGGGGVERSSRSILGDRSVRGTASSVGSNRRMSLGPAAAGFGQIQRQKSMSGAGAGLGLVARQRSSLGAGGVQRVKSISAASATSYEQKQFAKKWERSHSVAAQIVKRDIAARTTSMVLMGTEELQNLEEDELDVVSEQMMMWSSFAEAWDAICDDLRDGDFVSDREMALLKFVRLESSGKLHGLRPILLPTFFFAGQIRKVVDTGRVTTAQVMVLTEFRVLATWLACQLGIMSGKHAHVIMTTGLYGGIVNVKHITLRKKSFDSAIKLIGLIEDAIRTREVPFDVKDFAGHLATILHGLESECYAVQKMWELGRMYDDELDGALTLFEVVRDMQDRLRNDPEELKQCLKRAVAMGDQTTNTNVLLQVTTVLRNMLTTTGADATPQGEEAQRVLGFFINSLGHPSLDKPESLEFMLSWSVLTPAYEEDVLFAVEAGLSAEELGLPKKKITDLLSETDEGFSLMAYLRAMFAFEWGNFKERMRRMVGRDVDIPDWSQVTELDFGPGGLLFDYRTELQLWASYRGQLLARTVRGMMCYERALKVLCRLEYPAPVGITDADYDRWVEAMVASKFEYVVAVQTYGRNKKSNDLRLRQLAQGVDTLVQRFPTLKVAYLDDATDDFHGPTQYSVLIRNRRASDPIVDPTQPFGKIVEAYRIRLPYNRYSHRGVVLGEGKPENQNQASVFTFNEGLQAIDMNQDNYLAEALKMRNLLSELHPSNKGAQFMLFADDAPNQVLSPHMTAAELRFVILSRMKRSFPTALVGFREWIFSANTGALGQYAAATEYSFATIQSRIMTKPPRVRMHYGHPDVFNKTHIMTRGGMSKGTRVLHISEDYFIGAAHTLRGARIRYKEYISCGKGRDMGFDSILSYQKKIGGGAGDLATSREVHRLGTRFDFFRLMSFYHGGIGHFLNSYLTIMAAWYNIWALLLTALARAMELGVRGEKGEVTLTQTYNVQQVLQLGTLAIIPYVGQLILETGLLRTLITVFGQIITGSLFFYIFQQQTVAASFGSVMAYGGMRYIGTGRGFSIQTTDFVKMYTMYSRTHLYLGFEVLFFCATLYSLDDCTSCDYAALTWNSWLLAFVMILCPLWFNPFIFNLSKVQRDYVAWKRWLGGDMDPGTGTNWYTWNREQLGKARNDDGNVTDAWRNALREVVGTCVTYGLLVAAMVSRIDFRISHVAVLENPYLEFVLATALLWTLALAISYVGHNLLERAKSKEWRIVRYVVTLTCLLLLLVYVAVLNRFYTGDGFKHLLQVAYTNLVILIMVHRAATHIFTQNNAVRDFVDAGYYLIDVLVGFATFAVLALLSFVGFVNLLQSKLLFNEAFSQSVQTARIRMQVKRSGKQIKRKPKPGLLMTMEEWMRSRPASAASAAPSMAPTMYDGGGGLSRAASLAPSMLPSAINSVAPSMAPSAAASAFTSAVNSRVVSRQDSLTEMVNDLVGRSQQQRRGGAGVGDHGDGAGAAAAGGFDGAAAAAGGAAAESLPNDAGLRERRLRFG